MGLDQTTKDTQEPEPDQDEWVQVRSKKRNRNTQTRVRLVHSSPDSEAAPPNPAPQLSAGQIAVDHDRIASAWRSSSPSHHGIQSLVQQHAPTHAQLRKAICLGIGSFDPAPQFYSKKRVAHVQLEAFRAMVQTLESLSGSPIQCVVQEPAFTVADEEFCSSLGFQVASTPDAFPMIDAHTLVYGIHLYIPTWVEAFRQELPGCWVGARLEDCESYCDNRDPDLDVSRIRTIHETFDKFLFPQEQAGDFTFSGTDVYWAKG